jgi:hypothetical protein
MIVLAMHTQKELLLLKLHRGWDGVRGGHYWCGKRRRGGGSLKEGRGVGREIGMKLI